MIRAVVVDPSPSGSVALRQLLSPDLEVCVAAEAATAQHAREQLCAAKPDVVLVGSAMPDLTLAQTVDELMLCRPTPIVVVSRRAAPEAALELFDALAAGAVDFVHQDGSARAVDELRAKVRTAASASPRKVRLPTAADRNRVARRGFASGNVTRFVIIGISTGGPKALHRLFSMLNPDAPLAYIVVQHMSAGVTRSLAEQLRAVSRVRVREAQNGDEPVRGTALVAPGESDLTFSRPGRVVLEPSTAPDEHRPCIDLTMKSAATVFGRRTIGLVMTGMGEDGAQGLAAIKAAGGTTLAQDQRSSLVFGMPQAAIATGKVDQVVALDRMWITLFTITQRAA